MLNIKNRLILFFSISLLFSCKKSEIVKPEPAFQEQVNLFSKEYRLTVRETWNIDKITIKKFNKEDSVIYNLGKIFINNIASDPTNSDRYNILDAFFHINNQTIPFKSNLLYIPDGNKGFHATGLMESSYYIPFLTPVSKEYFSEEYLFLDKYFFGDNYEMELTDDKKTWIWKGLNRAVKEIVFSRTK